MAFTLSSSAFADGGDIPRQFTCDGDDIPPHLVWTGAPKTKCRPLPPVTAVTVSITRILPLPQAH